MLISKLPNTYKTADPARWLSGGWEGLDPIFAGRLAALANSVGKRFLITSGYRNIQEQARLYEMYLYYKRTGKGTIKLAAKPGGSSHNYRIAADTSTYPIRTMTNEQLRRWGLCKPISSEGWHIQPIETRYKKNFADWAPEEEDDMTKQEVLDIIEATNPTYEKVEDIPSWGQPTIIRMIAEGKIMPDAEDRVNMSRDLLRALIILSR